MSEVGTSIRWIDEPEEPAHGLYNVGTSIKFVAVTFMDSVQSLNIRSTR